MADLIIVATTPIRGITTIIVDTIILITTTIITTAIGGTTGTIGMTND